MLKRLGINHVFTAVRHPQSNGAVERLNRTIKTMLKTHLHDNPTNWTLALPHMRQAYMNREHAATKYSPIKCCMAFHHAYLLLSGTLSFSATFGLTPVEYVSDLRCRKEYQDDKAIQTMRQRFLRQCISRATSQLRKKRSTCDLKPGDLVLEVVPSSTPLQMKTKGPFLIVRIDARRTHAQLSTGRTAARQSQLFTRHTSHLVKFHDVQHPP